MTQEQRKDLLTQIIRGGTRKAIYGESPFKPATESDPLVAEFQQDLTALAPLLGVDYDAVVCSVIAESAVMSF